MKTGNTYLDEIYQTSNENTYSQVLLESYVPWMGSSCWFHSSLSNSTIRNDARSYD